MSDVFFPNKRSEIMSKVHSRGNKLTELRLIGIMRANQITGWRRKYRLFGNPDFVFPKNRIAVFVDGEFWHGHPKEKMPKTNANFWLKKIERNKARDVLVNQVLMEKGWRVIRFWQRDLKDMGVISKTINQALQISQK
jgi:DNA mismatch endonuclease (patch repair protein)